MMVTKVVYGIYDPATKKFKGRGNIRGVRWTPEPTQTYDTRGRAQSAMKSHLKVDFSHNKWDKGWSPKSLVIKEVTISWEE